MGELIGELLPLAVAVAVSVLPVIAVILLLLSRRPDFGSVRFAAGWLAGIVGVTVVCWGVADAVDLSSTAAVAVAAWIQIAVGLLLLVLAVIQWRRRSKPRSPDALPRWMTSLDNVTTVQAVGLGVGLSALNPKNALILASAGATFFAAGVPAGAAAGAFAAFVLLAGSTVLVPVVAFLVARNRVTPMLVGLRSWLLVHNATVAGVLFLVLGLLQLVSGLRSLA